MSLIDITTKDEFNEKVLTSQLPILVDFWAPWCAPCRAMSPLLKDIADETEFTVVKIDIEQSDDNMELAKEYGVQGIPNMKIFKDGKVVQEIVGMRSKQNLLDALNSAK